MTPVVLDTSGLIAMTDTDAHGTTGCLSVARHSVPCLNHMISFAEDQKSDLLSESENPRSRTAAQSIFA